MAPLVDPCQGRSALSSSIPILSSRFETLPGKDRFGVKRVPRRQASGVPFASISAEALPGRLSGDAERVADLGPRVALFACKVDDIGNEPLDTPHTLGETS